MPVRIAMTALDMGSLAWGRAIAPPIAAMDAATLPVVLLAFAVITLVATLYLFRRFEERRATRVESLDALPPEAARSAARRHRERGQLEEAARLFAQAGELEDAAICREELKHYTEAAALYEAAGAWLASARCFRMAQRPHLAAPLFEKGGYFREAAQCYELDGQFASAASCHYRSGNGDAAVNCLRRAGDPYKLACAFLLQGRMNEAVEALDQVGTRHEDFGKARLLLAKVLADQGQPQRAQSALREYLKSAPQSEQRRQAQVYLAKLLELMERDEEALVELEALRTAQPGDPVIERRLRRVQRRIELLALEPDSPQLKLRRISGFDMPAELAPEIAETLRAEGHEPVGGDRFRVLERLGDTEIALVYRARRTSDDRAVVLRFLRDQGWLRDDQREKFVEMLAKAEAVVHPHVLRQLEAGELRGRLYVASDYQPALSVEQWMEERARPATPGRALSLALQVCDGLSAAHAMGLLHRSVDPTTVLVNRDGDALVDELGILSALATFNPDAAAAAASPYFAAPELVAGGEATAATDVYAVGALLYFMLTTKPPFEQGALLTYWSRSAPPDPRQKNPDVSDALATVIRRALNKSPEARPATLAALHAELAGTQRVVGDTATDCIR